MATGIDIEGKDIDGMGIEAFDIDAARQRLTATFPLVNDHPDVAGLLRNPELMALIGPALAYPYLARPPTVIAAPEARGQVVGALVARELEVGLVLVRKQDRNHPGADVEVVSGPTWRGVAETFQARSFDLAATDRVLIVDDWITTGNSVRAVAEYARGCGSEVIGAATIVDKATPATIASLEVHTLVGFDDIVARV
ncbi:MAG: phosphoribosyltransferase family protein [Acidimicrobiales bacterium]